MPVDQVMWFMNVRAFYISTLYPLYTCTCRRACTNKYFLYKKVIKRIFLISNNFFEYLHISTSSHSSAWRCMPLINISGSNSALIECQLIKQLTLGQYHLMLAWVGLNWPEQMLTGYTQGRYSTVRYSLVSVSGALSAVRSISGQG